MISPDRTASAEMPASVCKRTPKIWGRTSGACAANNFVPGPQSDRRASGTGQLLRTFRDRTDGRLEIEFGGINLRFVCQGNCPESRGWVTRIRYAKLTPLGERRDARMIEYADFVGVGYGSEQIADQAIEFAIGDQVCGLLVSQGSTENTRKSD